MCWFALRDTFELNAARGEVVPLGGIVQCYGGTSVQWWSSADALAACPLSASNPGSACCNYGGNASCLYNAQIAPYTLGPTQLSAVYWYQGEQNAGCGGPPQIPYYACALPALISDWRAKFASPALPFGVYLLAAWQSASPAFALLRLAQVAASLALPAVATCSTLDAGQPAGGPVHSPFKQLPASRCARAMQALVYGQAGAVAYRGPRAQAASAAAAPGPAGTRVTLAFDAPPPGGALALDASVACPPAVSNASCEAFALQRAAPDCSWVASAPGGPARASLSADGTALLLDLGDAGSVAGVRGLFGAWPLVQLRNAAGLPAEPWLVNISAASGGGALCPPPSAGEWQDDGQHA